MGLFNHLCGLISTIAHIIQCISSFVVLGITAWAARETKTLTVIFPLVVAVLTPIVDGITLGISCFTGGRKWQVLPLLLTDAALSYLWLTAFIFLAQDFNQVSCSIHLWNHEMVCSRKYAAEAFSFIAFFTTFGAMTSEVLYAYLPKKDTPIQERKDGATNLEHNLQGAGLMNP